MKNRKLLHIPGPTPVVRTIQDQMGRETVAFTDKAFIASFLELLQNLKAVAQTQGEVFVIAGSGTLAMEMAVANTLQHSDSALVVSHGFFGDRFVQIMERRGLQVDVLASPWGTTVSLDDIEKKLAEKEYRALAVTHVDTSTGVKTQIEEIGRIVHRYPKTLFIVDGVCATAAEPESMDVMDIDILFTGSQKAFGVSPGLFMLWASSNAMERRKSLGRIPDYYLDFENWLPMMHDPSKYFATPAINIVWALAEATRLILQEGLSDRWARHHIMANAIHSALETLGLFILAEPSCRSSTVTCVLYPQDLDDQFRSILNEEGLVVAAGIGHYRGKAFRIGHMGNIDVHDLVALVASLERALNSAGHLSQMGMGVSSLLHSLKKNASEHKKW